MNNITGQEDKDTATTPPKAQLIAELNALREENAKLKACLRSHTQDTHALREARAQRDDAQEISALLLRQTEYIVSLNRLASAMLEITSPDEAATQLIERLHQELAVQRAALWLVWDNGLELAATIGVPLASVTIMPETADWHALIQVWQTGHRLTRAQFTKPTTCDQYFQNWLILPLKAHNQIQGLLVLEKGNQEEDPLAMFVNQAALGILAARTQQDLRRQAALLAQANAELIRSNTDLKQFAYVASHDLQEPLRIVYGFLQLLAQRYTGQLDATAHEYITYALDGTRRMQALIKDLLIYSQIGTQAVEHERTNCIVILEETLADLHLIIEENHAVVTHTPLPIVMANPTQLRQVFQNLLSNALKFRREDPPRVHVSAEKQSSPQTNAPEWVFAISDNGIGIEPEYFERIFVIFQRLHSQEAYPGTGIGLAICKRIVERHDGRLWVTSEPNVGTTFYFSLPALA